MKKIIYAGGIPIGGGGVVIQSMTNTRTSDAENTKIQILRLAAAGAELVRISLPDYESVSSVKFLKTAGVPLVGDIHFDYKLAVAAAENGIDKIRINPSNFPQSGLLDVVSVCRERNIPIRVGVNRGSLRGEKCTPQILAGLAMQNVAAIEKAGYENIVVSVKSSSVIETVEANRYLHKICPYPLHIGLTESGTPENGMTKSSIAIGSLLCDGIGDTIRVSLTGDPVKEVEAAKTILRAIGKDKNFVEIISCPTCARTEIDVENIASELSGRTKGINKPFKIAVMGCVVNGIGESKDADIGVAGGKDKSAIFANGKILKTVQNADIFKELINLTEEILSDV